MERRTGTFKRHVTLAAFRVSHYCADIGSGCRRQKWLWLVALARHRIHCLYLRLWHSWYLLSRCPSCVRSPKQNLESPKILVEFLSASASCIIQKRFSSLFCTRSHTKRWLELFLSNHISRQGTGDLTSLLHTEQVSPHGLEVDAFMRKIL